MTPAMVTGADRLVELVNERKRVELREAARLLNSPPAVVESWAEAMREAGLIEVEYGFGGVMFKTAPEHVRKQKEKALIGERKVLERKAAEAEKRAAEVEKGAVYTARDLEKLERIIGKKKKEAEQMLKDLKTLFAEGETLLRQIKGTKGEAEKRGRLLLKKIKSLEKPLHNSERKLAALLADFEALDKIVEDVFRRAHGHEAEVRNLENMTAELERDMRVMERRFALLVRYGRSLKPSRLHRLRERLFRARERTERIQEQKRRLALEHEKRKREVLLTHRKAKQIKRDLRKEVT